MTHRSENRFLYMLKGIACLAVMLLHVALPDAVAGPVRALSRFAVPVFFLITGFHLSDDRAVLRGRLKKTALLTASVWALCAISSACCLLYSGESLSEWLATCFGPGEWLRLLTLNSALCIAAPPTYSDYLWYLFALMYVYLLAMLLTGLRPRLRKALCVSLLCGFFLLQYASAGTEGLLPGLHPGDPRLYRNFLFYGLPFTLLGQWIARTDFRWGTLVPALAAPAGGALAVAEVLAFSDRELPVGAAMMAVALVILAKQRPDFGCRALVSIGRHLSASVYCLHIPVLNVVNAFLLPRLPDALQPLLVFALTLPAAFFLSKRKSALK